MNSRRNSLPADFKFSFSMIDKIQPFVIDNLNQLALKINQIHGKFHDLKDENNESFFKVRLQLVDALKQYHFDGGKIMALQFIHTAPKKSLKEKLFSDPTDTQLPFSTLFTTAESKNENGGHLCKQSCVAEKIRDEVAAELIRSLEAGGP